MEKDIAHLYELWKGGGKLDPSLLKREEFGAQVGGVGNGFIGPIVRSLEEAMEAHDRGLRSAMEKVRKYDTDLAQQMTEDYERFLQVMHDLLEEWERRIDHWL